MTIRHLKIFTEVARQGSVTGAARKLYLTQPAVSLALRELEEHYGTRLFDRLGRGLQITDSGRRLLEYAGPLADAFEEMERAMEDPDRAGQIRIGSSLTIGACLLPGYLKALAAQRPGVRQKVLVDNSRRIEEAVEAGELDLGLVENQVDNPALACYPFLEDRLIALCGPEHPFAQGQPVELGEFLRQPLLVREHGSGTRELFESALRLAGGTAEPRMESVSNTALLLAAAAGLGLAVLTERLALPELEKGTLCRVNLVGVNFGRVFTLIHHKKKHLSPTLRAFMEIVIGRPSGVPENQSR